MQERLQFNKNHFLIRKQVSKLSLEIKFSQINSTWYECTQSRSYRSPTSSSSVNVRSFQSMISDKGIQQFTETWNQKFQQIQNQLQQQMIFIARSKQLIQQKISEFKIFQLNRQTIMKQKLIKRHLQIQNLKRQCFVIIRHYAQQRQIMFKRQQVDFERNIQLLSKKYRKMKKQWKNQLRRIVQKFQQHKKQQKNKLINQNQTEEKLITLSSGKEHQQSILTIPKLQVEFKDLLISQKSQQQALQLQISNQLGKFQENQDKLNKKINDNIIFICQSLQNLSRTIKQDVRKQHFQSEQNRQKILLLFQTNVQKIEEYKKNKKIQQENKYKSPKIQYRHLK